MNHCNEKIWLLAVIVSASVWSASLAGASDCIVDNTLDSAIGLPPVAGSLAGRTGADAERAQLDHLLDHPGHRPTV